MGFFSGIFGSNRSEQVVASSLPLESVTITKKRKRSKQLQNQENNRNNANNANKKKGWGFNYKKKNRNDKRKNKKQNVDTSAKSAAAPKLSVFLQQQDESSQNQTVSTGSMTGTLASKSTSSNTFATKSSNPLNVESMRTILELNESLLQKAQSVKEDQHDDDDDDDDNDNSSYNKLHKTKSQERIENKSPDPPSSQEHSSVEHDEESDSLTIQDSPTNDPPVSKERSEANVTSQTSIVNEQLQTKDASIVKTQAVNPTSSQKTDNGAILLADSYYYDLLSIGSSDAAIDDLSYIDQSYDVAVVETGRNRNSLEFDDDDIEQKQIIFITNLPKNLGKPVEKRKSSDEDHISCISSLNSASPDHVHEDNSFKSAVQEEDNVGNNIPEFVLDRTQDSFMLKNEIQKSFDQIVHEVEEAIAFSQSVYKQPTEEKDNDKKESPWIANGLLATIRDDSSSQNSSVVSFTSEEFKEEKFEEVRNMEIKSGLEITTIAEEEENDSTSDLLNSSSSSSPSSSEEAPSPTENYSTSKPFNNSSSLSPSSSEEAPPPARPTLLRQPTPHPFRSSDSSQAAPKSVLLSKSTPRPTLKKQVSWNDKTDICTYLPNDVNDLQKARDLVATYEKMMASLNARLSVPQQPEEEGESSDADISESSSSIESLLSALSQASSTSSGSVKVVIDKLREEAEKRVIQSAAHDNKWPEVKLIDSSGSSSSFSSVYSSRSQLSQASSTGTAESVKMLMLKLQKERARQSRIMFSSSRNLSLDNKNLNSGEQAAARDSILSNNWIDTGDSSSSSSLSSLLSASPDSSASTTDSSDSVRYMMQTLKAEKERQSQRRQRMKDLISSACCGRMTTEVITGGGKIH